MIRASRSPPSTYLLTTLQNLQEHLNIDQEHIDQAADDIDRVVDQAAHSVEKVVDQAVNSEVVQHTFAELQATADSWWTNKGMPSAWIIGVCSIILQAWMSSSG